MLWQYNYLMKMAMFKTAGPYDITPINLAHNPEMDELREKGNAEIDRKRGGSADDDVIRGPSEPYNSKTSITSPTPIKPIQPMQPMQPAAPAAPAPMSAQNQDLMDMLSKPVRRSVPNASDIVDDTEAPAKPAAPPPSTVPGSLMSSLTGSKSSPTPSLAPSGTMPAMNAPAPRAPGVPMAKPKEFDLNPNQRGGGSASLAPRPSASIQPPATIQPPAAPQAPARPAAQAPVSAGGNYEAGNASPAQIAASKARVAANQSMPPPAPDHGFGKVQLSPRGQSLMTAKPVTEKERQGQDKGYGKPRGIYVGQQTLDSYNSSNGGGSDEMRIDPSSGKVLDYDRRLTLYGGGVKKGSASGILTGYVTRKN